MTNRLLLIGPRIISGELIGGTKMSFEHMVDYFESRLDFHSKVVSISRKTTRNRLLNISMGVIVALNAVWQVLFFKPGNAVILNISSTGILPFGWLIIFVSVLKRQNLFLRVFGGDFYDYYSRQGALASWVLDRALKRTTLLLQTEHLTATFANRYETRWFPTTRPTSSTVVPQFGKLRRVAYIGFINKDKGADRLARLANDFIDVEFYFIGALQDESIRNLSHHNNTRWFGQVDNAMVQTLLVDVDVIVMPSSRVAEGYPGSIIEAMNLGIAVIVSPLPPLVELVGDGDYGLVMSDISDAALSASIEECMAPERLYSLKNASLARAKDFDFQNIYSNLAKSLFQA